MQVELKACPNPWCASMTAAMLFGTGQSDDDRQWVVRCGCGVVTFRRDTQEEAVALWNTRFEASLPPSAPVDALNGYRAAVSWIGADSWDGCSDCVAILKAARTADTEWNWANDSDRIAAELAKIQPFVSPIPPSSRRHATPSVLAESTSNDCLLVAEAVRERCVEAAEKLVRFDRKNGDEQQRARADAFQAGQLHAAQAIRSLDLSGVGVG
jgi:hypothetical protein